MLIIKFVPICVSKSSAVIAKSIMF